MSDTGTGWGKFDDDEPLKCKLCEEEVLESLLHKCPMCHGWYCEKCEINVGGKKFCSKDCGMLFYWGDDDD